MALSSLTAQQIDRWITSGRVGGSSNGYNALVSDLQDGDFLLGARAYVVGTPTVSGTNRVIVLQRNSVLPQITVTWPATAGVWIVR